MREQGRTARRTRSKVLRRGGFLLAVMAHICPQRAWAAALKRRACRSGSLALAGHDLSRSNPGATTRQRRPICQNLTFRAAPRRVFPYVATSATARRSARGAGRRPARLLYSHHLQERTHMPGVVRARADDRASLVNAGAALGGYCEPFAIRSFVRKAVASASCPTPCERTMTIATRSMITTTHAPAGAG